MLNIVIPMAGAGSRFADAGYPLPKPLIDVAGRPMIQVVIDNLRPRQEHKFVFICQASHLVRFGLTDKLSAWAPACSILTVDGVTQGAACTVLIAREIINSAEPLMIANSDQYIDVPIDAYLSAMAGFDGLIMTMAADHPKWSYVGFDSTGRVATVVEKQVISNEATVGIYNFAKGADFVEAADEMIREGIRTNGEYYVAPTYNMLINKGAHIGTFNVGRVGHGMHGLGTPEDLDIFLSRSAKGTR